MAGNKIGRTLWWCVGMMMVLAGPGAVWAGPGLQGSKTDRPRIDVVFAIDTTSSMSGLIQAAKTKVWSIVNQIASGKPTPEIRVGLVAFRDRGDAYITQVIDLTADLDAMYGKLMGFAAEGGGDTPESINQALSDAVHKVSWIREGKVLKIVFLVGDSPAHMDYGDDVKYSQTCKEAAKQGIIINTIRCGSDSQTAQQWQDIAHLAEGGFFSIEQGGGVAEVSTPYDDEIAKVDRELRGTVVFYGREEEKKVAAKAMKDVEATMAAAPAEAKAERAAYSARAVGGMGGSYSSADLITGVESKTLDLDKVPVDDLPAEMKPMSASGRKEFIQKKIAERKALQEKLEALNKDRQTFITKQLKNSAKGDAFDTKVIDTVREKAKKIGVSY